MDHKSRDDQIALPTPIQRDEIYTYDGLSRLTELHRGEIDGNGVVADDTQTSEWTLDPLGNWDKYEFDGNGDGDYTDAQDLNDTRTHNDVNEITEWDPFAGNSQENPVTPTYDDAGNLTEDGNDILYIYDAWNRLMVSKHKVGQTENILGMYAYDGLGRRIRTVPSIGMRKRLLPIVANTEHEFYTRA